MTRRVYDCRSKKAMSKGNVWERILNAAERLSNARPGLVIEISGDPRRSWDCGDVSKIALGRVRLNLGLKES